MREFLGHGDLSGIINLVWLFNVFYFIWSCFISLLLLFYFWSFSRSFSHHIISFSRHHSPAIIRRVHSLLAPLITRIVAHSFIHLTFVSHSYLHSFHLTFIVHSTHFYSCAHFMVSLWPLVRAKATQLGKWAGTGQLGWHGRTVRSMRVDMGELSKYLTSSCLQSSELKHAYSLKDPYKPQSSKPNTWKNPNYWTHRNVLFEPQGRCLLAASADGPQKP